MKQLHFNGNTSCYVSNMEGNRFDLGHSKGSAFCKYGSGFLEPQFFWKYSMIMRCSVTRSSTSVDHISSVLSLTKVPEVPIRFSGASL